MQLTASSSLEKPEPKLGTAYRTLDLVVFTKSCTCIFSCLITCLPDTVWKEAIPVSRTNGRPQMIIQKGHEGLVGLWEIIPYLSKEWKPAENGLSKMFITSASQRAFGGVGYTHQLQDFLLELLHQLTTWKLPSCSLHFKQIFPFSMWCSLTEPREI